MKNSTYIHHFEPATQPDAQTLLLLHGTGGSEQDLLPIGRQVAPGAALLSPRGNVSEHGMPRFFRRFAEGVFDLEDVARRTDELAIFVRDAATEYGFTAGQLTALGYSNGANIAASLLLRRPEALAGAVLLRPMVVLQPARLPDLRGKRIAIVSGRFDPVVPVDQPETLAGMFREAGAEVELHWLQTGHQLSGADVRLAGQFLRVPAKA